MPATHRLAKKLYDKIEIITESNPTPELLEIQGDALDLMYGINIGLAAASSGASGVRFRQLVNDYEATRKYIETQRRRPAKQAVVP